MSRNGLATNSNGDWGSPVLRAITAGAALLLPATAGRQYGKARDRHHSTQRTHHDSTTEA